MLKQIILTTVLVIVSSTSVAEDVEISSEKNSATESNIEDNSNQPINKNRDDSTVIKNPTKKEIEDTDATSNEAQSSDLESVIRGNTVVNNPVNTNPIPATSQMESQQIFGLNPYVGRQPGRLKFGQISFIPVVAVGIGYNDNLNLSNTSKASSIVMVMSPHLTAYVDKGAHKYSLMYLGNFYRYPSSTIDNRDVNTLQFIANNGFTIRSNLTWSLGYTEGAEERGFRDDSRAQNQLSPNEFKYYVGNLNYIYGAQGAKGNLGFSMGYGNKEYTNNRAITAEGDFDTFNFGPNFTYRLAPKTFLTLAVKQTLTDYKLSTSTQDYTGTKYSANIKWDATAITQFYLTGGREFRDFDDDIQNDRSLNFYQLGALWSPYTYSTWELYAGRGLVDGSTASIFVGTSETFGVNWRHKWREFVNSHVSVSHTKTDYIGTTNRVDYINNVRFNLSYPISKNKEATINYNYVKRNSTDSAFAYDQNVLLFGMSFSL